MKILNETDIEDMCVGAAVLGTGGGGSFETGISYLKQIANAGKEIKMIDPKDVPNDALVITPSGVGTIAPIDKDISKKWAEKLTTKENPYLVGLKALEGFMGKEVYATVPCEMGGYNTACAVMVGAAAGIPFVDADPVGRAIPEINISTYTIKGIPETPMALTDIFGNKVIVEEIENSEKAEEIARAMAIIGRGETDLLSTPVRGEVLKDVIIHNTVSKSISIGKVIREGNQSGKNPVDMVIENSGGYKLFEGEVTGFEWKDEGGFMWGNTWIDGNGEYKEKRLKIWFKNENLVSWIDKEPFVTCPDLICVIDANNGKPITNTNIEEGLEVVVFGIKANPLWYTEKGLNLLSPKHFGFDIEHTPIDKLVS